MDGPEVLVAHYASLAFYTRLAALTFVGAIIGAVHEHLKDDEVRSVVGVGVLLVVAALAEFNRRYTFAYVAAVYAAGDAGPSSSDGDQAAAARWRRFEELNDMSPDRVRRRMLLSWLTYVPGFVLGDTFCSRPGARGRATAVSLGLLVAAWLVYVAILPYPKREQAAEPAQVLQSETLRKPPA